MQMVRNMHGTLLRPRIAVFIPALVALCFSADITLKAGDADDFDGVWEPRSSEGKPSWGIKGTGEPLQGSMWFDSFPGATSIYSIEFGIIAEDDGPPLYKVFAGDRLLKSGTYPCPKGDCGCTKNTEAATIDLGQHAIAEGDRIEVWGKSVYPCGSHGAYTRWYELAFTRRADINDSTPPSPPANLTLRSSSAISLEIAWDPAEDAESGIREYRIYVEGRRLMTSTEPSATILGLTANTSYDIQVSAINNVLDESPGSTTASFATADRQSPPNTLFIQAHAGMLVKDMRESAYLKGTVSGKAIYGSRGSTDGPSDDHSRASYLVDLPTSGIWYAWGRFRFSDGTRNSYWISLDGGEPQRLGNGEHELDSWHWEGYMREGAVVLGSVAEGKHALTIYPREPAQDNLLDALCLTADRSYTPHDSDIVFATLSTPGITVLSPNTGDALKVGEPVTISWIADRRFITDVNITLLTNAGAGEEKLNTGGSISVSDSQWANYVWTPEAKHVGENNLIRVEKYDYSDLLETDVSDSLFAIRGEAHVKPRHGPGLPSPGSFGILVRGTLIHIRNRVPAVERARLFTASGQAIALRKKAHTRYLQIEAERKASGVHLLLVETKNARYHFRVVFP